MKGETIFRKDEIRWEKSKTILGQFKIKLQQEETIFRGDDIPNMKNEIIYNKDKTKLLEDEIILDLFIGYICHFIYFLL